MVLFYFALFCKTHPHVLCCDFHFLSLSISQTIFRKSVLFPFSLFHFICVVPGVTAFTPRVFSPAFPKLRPSSYFIWARATECREELFPFFCEITFFLGVKGAKNSLNFAHVVKCTFFYDSGWGKISLKDGPRRWLNLDVWHLYMCIVPWPTKKVSCRLTGCGPIGFVFLFSLVDLPQLVFVSFVASLWLYLLFLCVFSFT